MRQYGCDRDVKTRRRMRRASSRRSPQCRDRLAGGIFTATDESGDAQRFTVELAQLARGRGVAFRWNVAVESLVARRRRGHVRARA